jgi:hypothetical protein
VTPVITTAGTYMGYRDRAACHSAASLNTVTPWSKTVHAAVS